MIELTWWQFITVVVAFTPILLGFMYGEYAHRTGNDPLGVVDNGDNNE